MAPSRNKLSTSQARMIIIIWLLTAVSGGVTAGIAWITAIYDTTFSVALHPVALLAAFALLFIVGYYLSASLHRLRTSVVALSFILIIGLVGLILGNLCSKESVAVVFGIIGLMFTASALTCVYLRTRPDNVGQIFLMMAYGLVIAIAVNSALDSPFSRWLCSIIMVVLWAMVAGCERDTLQTVVRKRVIDDSYTLPRCVLLGVMTLYFGVVDCFRIVTIMLINIIAELRWWV